jgi:hypothetical protein
VSEEFGLGQDVSAEFEEFSGQSDATSFNLPDKRSHETVVDDIIELLLVPDKSGHTHTRNVHNPTKFKKLLEFLAEKVQEEFLLPIESFHMEERA